MRPARPTPAMAASLCLWLAALSACEVTVDYAGSEYRCPDGACPLGFECVEGVCVPENAPAADAGRTGGEPPDAAGHAADAMAQADAPPPPTQGLRGVYYDDLDFANEAFTRIDPTVDFSWDHDAPDPSMDPDTFSIRWTGLVRPRYGETYTFHVIADDGARLWVNGELVIDEWRDHVESELTGTIALEADVDTAIELEYFDDLRTATVRLLWSSPSQSKEIIPADRLAPGP